MSDNTPKHLEKLDLSELRTRAEQALAEGRLNDAKAIADVFKQKSSIRPWDKVALGRIALAFNDPKDAVHWLSQAHEEMPEEGAVLVDLASAWAARKKWSNAAAVMAEAVDIRPTIADLYERYAIYLSNMGKHDEASAALKQALAIDGAHSGAWALTGERQMALDDFASARQSFLNAIETDPAHGAALSNLALLYEREGDFDAALNTMTILCGHYSEDATFAHRRGLLLMSLGRLEEGWPAYAQRFRDKTYKSWQHALSAPYWTGEDLAGQHLVVWADQGLGEQILTASLLDEVTDKARKITLACDPRLVTLFARSFPNISVVSIEATREKGREIGSVDLQASISELGLALRPDLKAFPKPKAFLSVEPDLVLKFKGDLTQESEKKLVGISWQSENELAGEQKSISLIKYWQTVLSTAHVKFVSLQYGDVTDQVAAVRAAGYILEELELDATRQLDDFGALTAAMDLVVSASNTTVHIAGGLGIPTWVLLPPAYGRPWYWFDEGSKSPWYPNLTLRRSQGDWGPVMNSVAQDLERWAEL